MRKIIGLAITADLDDTEFLSTYQVSWCGDTEEGTITIKPEQSEEHVREWLSRMRLLSMGRVRPLTTLTLEELLRGVSREEASKRLREVLADYDDAAIYNRLIGEFIQRLVPLPQRILYVQELLRDRDERFAYMRLEELATRLPPHSANRMPIDYATWTTADSARLNRLIMQELDNGWPQPVHLG